MSEDTNDIIDIQEKVNILFKDYLGFISTNNTSPWYNEIYIPYNNNIHQEYVFLENIPSIPVFDFSGIRTAQEIGLSNEDFYGYNTSNLNECSIVDDTTGTIRRFKNLKLISIQNSNNSSFTKFDICNNVVLKDSIQFNKNQYYLNGSLIKPYFYTLKTTTNTKEDINPSANGTNWLFDVKSGIVFFVDITGDYSNKTFIFSFYKYIGKKGIVNLDISGSIDNANSSSNIIEISNNNITLGVSASNIQELSGAGIDVCNNIAQLYFNTASGNKPDRWVTNIPLDVSDNLFIRKNDLPYNSFVEVVEKITQIDNSVNFINNKINNKINAIENIKNKIFDISAIYTTTSDSLIQDLSNIFDLSIIPIQTSPKINVIIKTNYLCSYALEERITIELWKYDLSNSTNILLTKDENLGSVNATGGLTGTYYNNYIDYNVTNNQTYKYYLKYKLENNESGSIKGVKQGLINLDISNNSSTSNSSSGVFILKEL